MIAGPYPEDSRIVRTWPAAQTGESYYETEDGRVWKTHFGSMPAITGVEYGSVVGDRMVSPPRAPIPRFYSRPPAPIPVDNPEVPEALPPKPARPQRRPASTDFVGAGAMRRRWR